MLKTITTVLSEHFVYLASSKVSSAHIITLENSPNTYLPAVPAKTVPQPVGKILTIPLEYLTFPP